MHINLVSQCEKKALGRTRKIIDRYAIRTSERTWSTAITKEALDDLRIALKQVATRQTAIACYINDGRTRMRLAWTIGRSDAFGAQGEYAVSTQGKRIKTPEPWVRWTALVAKAAGLAHDLGKGSVHFQNKLKSIAMIKDSTRHEWTSIKLYQWMRQNQSFHWHNAWNAIRLNPQALKSMPFSDGKSPLSSIFDTVDYVILTHHGLLAPELSTGCPDRPESYNHYDRKNGQGKNELFVCPEDNELGEGILKELEHTTDRFKRLQDEHESSMYFYRAIAIIARAALILADHNVSSEIIMEKKKGLYANSQKGSLNQHLSWHLEHVAKKAQDYVRYFDNHELPSLCPQTRELIQRASGQGRFFWQDISANHLRDVNENDARPTIVFNLAGTGSGKTRMNVRALASLREEDEPLRIGAGFNLRTLTLQTHHAFKTQLGMSDDEVACVIGDTLSKKMHEYVHDDDKETNDDPDSIEYETMGSINEYPEWIEDLAKKHPEVIHLIGAPVIVSTMDYLVNAGDPSKQGHHAHSLLRIATSDLILDEVDSYDPESLVSVLRVIQMSAMFGRNIIVSSATLCEPIAEAVYNAYASGYMMYQALRGRDKKFRFTLIDQEIEPQSFIDHDHDTFKHEYKKRIDLLVAKTREKPAYRMGYVTPVEHATDRDEAIDALMTPIYENINRLHHDHSWTFGETGKRVSFGVIRIANIKACVRVAKILQNTLSDVHVTAYHSADIRLRRIMKERVLDRILQRNPSDGLNGNRNILEDEDIRKRVNTSSSNHVVFIVVATPVEEVGRDHDFDWAIIEPSSTQSIVQLSGRVNRHRLMSIEHPNVCILQKNIKGILQKNPCFSMPGNESTDSIYPSHNTDELLGKINRIDAGIRWGDAQGQCLFAHHDDESIRKQLSKPLNVILAEKKNNALTWITECHYKKFPLRKNQLSIDSLFVDDFGRIKVKTLTKDPRTHEKIWVDDGALRIIENTQNHWLSWSIQEMFTYEESRLNHAMEVSIRVYGNNDNTNLNIEFDEKLGGY